MQLRKTHAKTHITQEANNAEEVTLHKKGEKHNKQMHQANTDVSERAQSCPRPQPFLFKIHDLPVEARDCREGQGHHWQEKGESCKLMAHLAPG